MPSASRTLLEKGPDQSRLRDTASSLADELRHILIC